MTHHTQASECAAWVLAGMKDALRKAAEARLRETRGQPLVHDAEQASGRNLCRIPSG